MRNVKRHNENRRCMIDSGIVERSDEGNKISLSTVEGEKEMKNERTKVTNMNIVSKKIRLFVRVSYLVGNLNYPYETKFPPLLGIVTCRWAARVSYFKPMSPHAPIHKWKREFTMDRVHALDNDEGSINTMLSPTVPVSLLHHECLITFALLTGSMIFYFG